jgi:hypothetical protein
MGDVIDRIVARHVLFLQEVGGVAFALGKDRHQDIGAGDFLAAGGLHMDDGALYYALEAGRRLGVLVISGDQIVELVVDVIEHGLSQGLDIDAARIHDGPRVLIVDQGEKEVFERRIFMLAFIRKSQCLMQRLLQACGECRHYFFSITHCSGCWF